VVPAEAMLLLLVEESVLSGPLRYNTYEQGGDAGNSVLSMSNRVIFSQHSLLTCVLFDWLSHETSYASLVKPIFVWSLCSCTSGP